MKNLDKLPFMRTTKSLKKLMRSRPQKNLKKLTLLHSNDMHGDFLEEDINGTLIGGVSMLSGYIDKCRREEENVLYCVAGDMFRGSVIDSEFLGLSTIEIMNMLAPDVVTLGNHETDYGLAHLLFIEKCANFPIINANLHITTNNVRLFKPHLIKEIDGMKVLFIGILTEEVIGQTKKDGLIGTMISVEDAAKEVERICNSHHAIDIDFTVLLTHIGWEEDHKLARLIDPACGVDVIIGGHSHTFIEKPDLVNGIYIVQAGTGTDQIGRFDIMVDTDRNAVDSWSWQAVPIDETHCPRDTEMERLIESLKSQTDKKYGRFITRLARQLTHPAREQETEIGNLMADIALEGLGTDIVMFGSGSIRNEKFGPLVLYQDLVELLPYDNGWYCIYLTGAQLKQAWKFINRDEVWQGAHCEYYQFSKGMKTVYNRATHELEEFSLNDEPIEDDRVYSIGIQSFHYDNLEDVFTLTHKEIDANKKAYMCATSGNDIIDEWLSSHQLTDAHIEGRIIVKDE
ncbi:MAG: bifunctional metallophosphatase/5'-nucleotidase [Eggerthellaceae bacterium]|nr:bifunctional metallophosphatase/5'-nucleotidase [Eggerthellaceae bacterium]